MIPKEQNIALYRIDTFEAGRINPITNREYDNSWRVLILTHDSSQDMIVGAENGCAYTIRISKHADVNWCLMVGDFIGYGESIGTHMILVMSETEYQEMKQAYEGHCFCEDGLRDYEPTVLVHSTTREGWEKIQKSGVIKCWNQLKRERVLREEYPIGVELGDPEEFSDYIMLGDFGVSGELVVSSKQSGFINMDINAKYKTGARMYFDARRLAQDGLLIRDGAHLKVKDELPLEKYLIWAATWEQIGMESDNSTPNIFAEQADQQFREFFPEYVSRKRYVISK